MEAGLSRSGIKCSHAPRKRLEKCCRDSEVEVSRDNVLEHDDWGWGIFEIMAATTTTNMLLRRAARSEIVVGNFPAPQEMFQGSE